MKYLPWILAALLAIGLVGAFMFNPFAPKVGTISIGRIVDESPRAQELNRQLTERYNELVAEFGQAEEEEAAEEDQVAEEEQQAGEGQTGAEETPTEEEQLAREREAYAEYLRFRQELETQFQTDVDRAVREVANARRIQIVVDEDIVRYGGVDLSDDVIKRLQ